MSMALVDWDHIRVMFRVRQVVFPSELLRFQREELGSTDAKHSDSQWTFRSHLSS